MELKVWGHDSRLAVAENRLTTVESKLTTHDGELGKLTAMKRVQESPLPGWLPWAILIGLGAFYAFGTLLSAGRLP